MRLALLILMLVITAQAQFSKTTAFVGASKPKLPADGAVWITGFNTGGSLRNNGNFLVGCKFTTTQALTLTKLARWVVAGNSQTHRVGIFNSSGTLLGSVSISTSGEPAGFKAVTLDSPVNLASGTSYYIVTEEFAGGDSWYDRQSGTITVKSVAAINFSVYSLNAFSSSVTIVEDFAGYCYAMPTFVYQE